MADRSRSRRTAQPRTSQFPSPARREGHPVTPITIASDAAGKAIDVGNGTDGIAITPDGVTAYVTETSSDAVTPINPASGKAGTGISVGKNPEFIAISPDGATVYVANTAEYVIPIATSTNTAGKNIPIAGQLTEVAMMARRHT